MTGHSALRAVGIVLAGGTGTRLGAELPKQLLPLAGRPVLAYALSAFEAAPEVDDVLVVMAPGFVADVERIVSVGGFRKVRRVLEGGATRTASTRRALAALGPAECNVLLHDAARPLLSGETIRVCVAALQNEAAVCVAIPSVDTVVVVEDGRLVAVPARSTLRRAQTPQGFLLSTIRAAHERAARDPDGTATDDCTLVLRYCPEVPIAVIEGSERARKITSRDDLALAEALLTLDATPARGPADPPP